MFLPSTVTKSEEEKSVLTLILLTWTKWWTPASASKWWMGFNSAFKGLKQDTGAV
jgi:hypothetical protein